MHAYLFEARSIQSYILDSGFLSDMTQASEKVDAICGELLDQAIDGLGLVETNFMRRAGGAFIYLAEDRGQIKRFRDCWSLLLPNFAPGLEWVHCVASGGDVQSATEQGFILLAQARNKPSASLPEAGPFAERCPRTGMAAVARRKKQGVHELMDAPTAGKTRRNQGHTSLGGKFLPDGKRVIDGVPHRFPRNLEADPDEDALEAFPFSGEVPDVAVIHADGNGMGLVLKQIMEAIRGHERDAFIRAYRDFSESIGNATQAAAREATRDVLLPAAANRQKRDGKAVRVIPARPLVLGGDDLSIIVRADLALPFTRAFIAAFERETAARLVKLDFAENSKLTGLTACAGLAFIKSKQPFAQAYKLAESLCQHAKDSAGRMVGAGAIKPSAIAFYRVSSSYFEDYQDDILERVESVWEGDQRSRLTLGAYGINPQSGMPDITDLVELCRFLDRPDMAKGAARNLLLALHQAPALERRQYQRWRELMGKGHAGLLKDFDASLGKLGVANPAKTHFKQLDCHTLATPLGDAVSLLAVGGHEVAKQGVQA